MIKKLITNNAMIDKLYERCEEITKTTIYCDKCKCEASKYSEAYTASIYFYKHEWTITTNDECCCPECVDNINKLKK